jgi:hypothetical protein
MSEADTKNSHVLSGWVGTAVHAAVAGYGTIG